MPKTSNELMNAFEVLGNLPPRVKFNPPLKSIAIGRYTIYEHKIKVGCVTIIKDAEPDGLGEGGTFDEKELEKLIAEFYDKNF